MTKKTANQSSLILVRHKKLARQTKLFLIIIILEIYFLFEWGTHFESQLISARKSYL